MRKWIQKVIAVQENGLFVGKQKEEHPKPSIKIEVFFIDTRYANRAKEKMIILKFPPIEKLRATPLPPPRQVLPTQNCDFLKMRQHISVAWFLKWGPRCLPNKLLTDVITGLTKGFPTKYRGGGDFVRDYSNKMKDEEEKKATEKAEETVRKGWGAGPFHTPPQHKLSPQNVLRFRNINGSRTEL